jgi:hypothetical protein
MNATGTAPAPHQIRAEEIGLDLSKRAVGYGLPCAKCNTYYAANLKSCPVCKSEKRVSPVALISTAQPAAAAPAPDDPIIEEERQRFLKEYKSQLYSSNTQVEFATDSMCSQMESHPTGLEPAEVCQSCFDHLREKVDHMEAALLMDVQEASQVIYDAVWADASDPTKTYLNAAHAILAELRKRAGLKLVIASSHRQST